MIHSVDSAHLAGEISRRAEKAGKNAEILIEVNTTGEKTKFGIAPENTLALIHDAQEYPFIDVRGLMTIGPLAPDPEKARPSFTVLRELRDRCAAEGFRLPFLSMGMSGDYEIAIDEGATHLRIGTAIFGARSKGT
jgi:pyridoxal phosphate enzyme (YggS family)